MIRVNEAALLAYTKLRTRRIRTLVTVVICGLLFAGLVATLLVAQGADDSVQSFSKEGLNDKYIVATNVDQSNIVQAFSDPATVARAQAIFTQTVASKKAEATKLGLPYDPSSEQAPTISIPASPGQTARQVINPIAPAAQQALNEYIEAHPDPGMPELRADARGYHPTAFYTSSNSVPADGQIATMQGGEENFNSGDQSNSQANNDILQINGLALSDEGLVRPFLLPDARPSKSEIPVVVTYAQATKLLNLAPISKAASPQTQLDRIRELYKDAGSATFSACYRNSVSGQQIQTAISQAQEIAKNKGNKDYQKPSLVYGLPPANSCGAATIVSDTRSSAEKLTDKNQDTFNKMFGQPVDPVQQKLTFRIVGLMPDQKGGSGSTDIGGLLNTVVGSSLNSAITVPASMLDQVTGAAKIKSLLFPSTSTTFGFSPTGYFVEFASASDARNFIKQKSCTTGPSGRCGTTAKPFGLSAYGSNSIAVQDLRHKFSHFFKLAVLGVILIALVIMSGTVGRMIADGRRESAVFRAIGAKRMDIALIYTVYTFCLSLYVALFALVAGLAAAKLFDMHFWKSTTVQAQLAFGASDGARQFHFFAWTPFVWLALAISLGCGLLSMLLPLLRNIRRSPIKDMREE